MSKQAFDSIKAGLEEVIAIARGEADSTTYRVHVYVETDVYPRSRTSLRALADRIAALTPEVLQTDSTKLVRAGRAR